MSAWDDFFLRHDRKKYTPVFNDYLDCLIADERLDLDRRFDALVLRQSWGNFSDCMVQADGTVMNQADCGRLLGVTSRRRINDLVTERVRLGYMRIVGRREIYPIDSPELAAGFAFSSPDGELFRSIGEEEENKTASDDAAEPEIPGFEDYISQVWATEDPSGFQAYQDVVRAYKRWRIDLMEKYKSWKAECPKGSGQNAASCSPKGSGQNASECPKGDGLESERVRTSAPASINENGKQEKLASYAEEIRSRVAQSGLVIGGEELDSRTARNAAKRLLDLAPENIAGEVLDAMQRACGAIARRRPNKPKSWGILITVIEDIAATFKKRPAQPPPAPQPEPTIEEQIAHIEATIETYREYPNHKQLPALRDKLEELRALLGAPRAMAQKAGQ